MKSETTKKKRKKVMLITGADGFVGRNACEHYHKKGWKVYGFSEHAFSLKGVHMVVADLLDHKKLKREVQKIRPDAVLHLGALVVLDRSFEIAQRCINVNIHGTLNLLEAIKGIPLKRFIFFSTEEVYGKSRLPYRENKLPSPPSPYSISKIAGEGLSLLYHEWYGLPVVIFRMATIFGYHQPASRFIPNLIIKALKNEDVPLNSGKNKRDYLFVGELLEATERALSAEKAVGQVFNIGGTAPISGKELAGKIVKLSGSVSKILLNVYPDRIGEANIWKMSNAKARKILGWKPNVSMDNDLKKTIHFYKRYFL